MTIDQSEETSVMKSNVSGNISPFIGKLGADRQGEDEKGSGSS